MASTVAVEDDSRRLGILPITSGARATRIAPSATPPRTPGTAEAMQGRDKPAAQRFPPTPARPAARPADGLADPVPQGGAATRRRAAGTAAARRAAGAVAPAAARRDTTPRPSAVVEPEAVDILYVQQHSRGCSGGSHDRFGARLAASKAMFYVRSSGLRRFLPRREKTRYFRVLWPCPNYRPVPGLRAGRGEIQLLGTAGPA